MSESGLELEADSELPLARLISDSKDLSEIACTNIGLRAVTPIDVVVVPVKQVVELGTERQSVLSIGTHPEVFQQAHVFVGLPGATQG